MSRSSTFLTEFQLAEAQPGADVASIAEADWVPAIVPDGPPPRRAARDRGPRADDRIPHLEPHGAAVR